MKNKILEKEAKLLYNDEVEKYLETMQSHSSDNCVHRYNIEVLNLFDPEFQLVNAKPMIKIKLKELLKE